MSSEQDADATERVTLEELMDGLRDDHGWLGGERATEAAKNVAHLHD